MFRPASRLIARPAVRGVLQRAAPARRFLSTAPPAEKSRSWKSSFARLGIAGAIIYYYNTSDVFAEEPAYDPRRIPDTEHETEQRPTLDELIAQDRQQRKITEPQKAVASEGAAAAGGVGELEEEADQQGAFNPETGEINWDCPCLGGMANGPCGEEFKAAFSCFVYSTEEPKGMDCIEKFKDMQTCFRQYPEVYGSELEDEEDNVTADGADPVTAGEAAQVSVEGSQLASSEHLQQNGTEKVVQQPTGDRQPVKEHEPQSESNEAIPKVWHDERSENQKSQ